MTGGLLPSHASGTADLILKLDKIFDCLNSSSFKSFKPENRPITRESEHNQWLGEMCSFVRSIKVHNPITGKDVTSTLKCLKALEMTLNSTMLLWKSIQTSVTFLCTRRLNQDPLENFFGCIRQQGGNNDNPTPVQFTRAFRKLFYDNLLSPTTGNCTADVDTILVGCASSNEKVKHEAEANHVAISQIFNIIAESDYKLSSVEENLMSTNALTYVAGYILKKCLQEHQCQSCLEVLTANQLDNPNKLFCYFKAYKDKNAHLVHFWFQQNHFVRTLKTLNMGF